MTKRAALFATLEQRFGAKQVKKGIFHQDGNDLEGLPTLHPSQLEHSIFARMIYTGGTYHFTRGEYTMPTTAKLFKTGRSQAVRLPKEFRFEGTEVLIQRVGNSVVLTPKENRWDTMLASLEMFEGSLERNQPAAQERDWGNVWK
jgi:antitoxin VapB